MSEAVPFKDKFLAFLCAICPACNVARWYPDSKFAKELRKAEQNCPACNAYYRLYVKDKAENQPEAQTDAAGEDAEKD